MLSVSPGLGQGLLAAAGSGGDPNGQWSNVILVRAGVCGDR